MLNITNASDRPESLQTEHRAPVVECRNDPATRATERGADGGADAPAAPDVADVAEA